MEAHRLRIGELSRRTGVSRELLRAWERRYGVLRPERTEGGLRLYSADDERRVRRMQVEMAGGISAAEAARVVAGGEPEPRPETGNALESARERLTRTLEDMDAEGAHAALDAALTAFMVDTVLSGVVLPFLRDLGWRWERGEVSVAQEHFASNLIRSRLLGLARGWERGEGRRALLACASGEQHDLALIAFGLALRSRGWRIAFLGADTPAASVAEAAERLAPELVVITAVSASAFRSEARDLEELAARHEVAIAGPGATRAVAGKLGCALIDGDPVAAAAEL
ncbi:MAG: MerR family transcriptional regulator [Thermoleophilaceae bacterium]|nr:MerR family transcriptional regulator [Thermoleophilaceae bacterium]